MSVPTAFSGFLSPSPLHCADENKRFFFEISLDSILNASHWQFDWKNSSGWFWADLGLKIQLILRQRLCGTFHDQIYCKTTFYSVWNHCYSVSRNCSILTLVERIRCVVREKLDFEKEDLSVFLATSAFSVYQDSDEKNRINRFKTVKSSQWLRRTMGCNMEKL